MKNPEINCLHTHKIIVSRKVRCNRAKVVCIDNDTENKLFVLKKIASKKLKVRPLIH